MYLIIDLEATCWENKKKKESEIIELGAVLLNNFYKILGEFQTFIKPIKNPILSEFCKKLTSIQQKDIDEALKFPLALRKFIKWAEETAKCKIQDITFCSWGYYDKKQLMKDCKLHNVKYPFSTHRSLKHEFAKKRKTKPMGLKKALEICGFKLEGTHHRALDDAKNIVKIFILLEKNVSFLPK
jgi:inhibitor of KinA sporulation pathway (predicted exonuclease)